MLAKLQREVPDDHFFLARKRMVADQLLARGIQDERVLQAFLELPRHVFVDEDQQHLVYSDAPVNIGWQATISQAYVVARMLESLQLQGYETVLEIGMGCGYQTALLAKLCAQIYAIERVPELFFRARKTLKDLGFRNIVLRLGDGTYGWPEAGPFDAIIAAAAAPVLPKPWAAQVKVASGRIVMPLANQQGERIVCFEQAQGQWRCEDLHACRFVPLLGKYGVNPS